MTENLTGVQGQNNITSSKVKVYWKIGWLICNSTGDEVNCHVSLDKNKHLSERYTELVCYYAVIAVVI